METALGRAVQWLPGATPVEALRSLRRLGRRYVCHVHMTLAEAVAAAARPIHRAPIVSTRHFAAPRGATRAGRLLSPLIARGLARQIAVSDYVARSLERQPDAVIRSGVPHLGVRLEPREQSRPRAPATVAGEGHDHGSPCVARIRSSGRRLVVARRGSRLGARGARGVCAVDRVVGLTFAGPVDGVTREFAAAGVLLAPAPADSFGLSVVEAMAAGVPVVASSAGGHLETVGLLSDAAMFSAGDPEAAAASLRSLRPEAARAELSAAGRLLVETTFTISGHIDSLMIEYEAARRAAAGRRARG